MNKPLGNVYKCKGTSCVAPFKKDRGVFLKRADVLPQMPRRFFKTP